MSQDLVYLETWGKRKRKRNEGVLTTIQDLLSMKNPILVYEEWPGSLITSLLIELALTALLYVVVYRLFLKERERSKVQKAAIFLLLFFTVYVVLNLAAWWYAWR